MGGVPRGQTGGHVTRTAGKTARNRLCGASQTAFHRLGPLDLSHQCLRAAVISGNEMASRALKRRRRRKISIWGGFGRQLHLLGAVDASDGGGLGPLHQMTNDQGGVQAASGKMMVDEVAEKYVGGMASK